MAVAQMVTTFVVLAAVLGISLVVFDNLVGRERDRALMNVASATVATLSELADHETGDERRLHRELDEHRPAGVRIEAIDEQGRAATAVGEGPRLHAVGDDTCGDQEGWRVCERAVGGLRILVGRSREDVERTKSRFLAILTLVSMIALVLGATISRSVARRGLDPLVRVSRRLDTLRPGQGERLDIDSGLREIDDFARRFDEMLGRVDEAVARERRFAAQASHELRTPLTVLRGELEELSREPGPHRDGVERAYASSERLVRLVESLLLFGRAEARFDPADLELVNLADVIREEIERLPSAVRAAFAVETPDELWVWGHEQLLARAVSNLIDNAVKYAPGEAIQVSAHETNGTAVFEVRDCGPGVAPETSERVFEPFFRDPRARAERTGHGLGLPLARAVARAHGGDVVLRPHDGRGAVFQLSIPSTSKGAV